MLQYNAKEFNITKNWLKIGVGAAWSWQGTGRQGLDEAAVQSVQRFLSPSQPRIRALGGARFEPQENSSPEWTGFGSYMFIIPR